MQQADPSIVGERMTPVLPGKAQARMREAGERALERVYRVGNRIPFVKRRLEREYEALLNEIGDDVKPYRKDFATFRALPTDGRSRDAILDDIRTMASREEHRWKDGFVSGAVYHGDARHIAFLNEVYALTSQMNPLHADLWPSGVKFESEIVSMTAQMLGAGHTNDEVVGTVTSGGTESILLAMKTYRDYAKESRGVHKPELVVPVTAHAAFDKAAHYFGIKLVRIPVDETYRADVKAARRAITRNTIALVGSAPAFPHGVIDPIAELSELAREHGVGFHTDACLGGFVLPFAKKLGYDVPDFDFSLPGVTSMSADTHKYGYAPKGTSVVLYRGRKLRHHQYYTVSDWPGGMYFSPTIAGSRPGALSAGCWAAMVSTGEAGYLASTKKILETAATIRRSIADIDGLFVLGNPLFVIAFGSNDLDVYRVMDFMSHRGWSLNGLHRPACVHLCVTLRHTEDGVADRFIADLREAVAHVRANPSEKGGMAPVYGLAANIPFRGAVSDILKGFIDKLYEV